MTGSERLPGIESGGHNACKPDDPDFHGELVLPPEYTPSSVRSGQIPAEIEKGLTALLLLLWSLTVNGVLYPSANDSDTAGGFDPFLCPGFCASESEGNFKIAEKDCAQVHVVRFKPLLQMVRGRHASTDASRNQIVWPCHLVSEPNRKMHQAQLARHVHDFSDLAKAWAAANI